MSSAEKGHQSSGVVPGRYTDPKVLAHITICMLALLLLRTLTTRLANTQAPVSAQAAIEILEDCRLNQRDTDAGTPVYHLTRHP